LISCSDHKANGGLKLEDSGIHSGWLINISLREELFIKRKHIFDKIRDKKLIDVEKKQGNRGVDPRNKGLVFGPDFGGSDLSGLYLPAYERYEGRFFRTIREYNPGEELKDLWKGLQPDYRVLILSGLYGFIEPFDQIQEYTCHLTDEDENNKRISGFWSGLLTDILVWYIKAYQVAYVIDLLSEESYQNTIAWGKVYYECGNTKFLHRAYKNQAGPVTLINSALFMLNEFMIEKTDPSEIPVDEFIKREYLINDEILFEPQFMMSKKHVAREGIAEMFPLLQKNLIKSWDILPDSVRYELANGEYVYRKIIDLQLADYTTASICLSKAIEIWLGYLVKTFIDITGIKMRNKIGKKIEIDKATLGTFEYYFKDMEKEMNENITIRNKIWQKYPYLTSKDLLDLKKKIYIIKTEYRNGYSHKNRMLKEVFEGFRRITFEFFNYWPLKIRIDG